MTTESQSVHIDKVETLVQSEPLKDRLKAVLWFIVALSSWTTFLVALWIKDTSMMAAGVLGFLFSLVSAMEMRPK